MACIRDSDFALTEARSHHSNGLYLAAKLSGGGGLMCGGLNSNECFQVAPRWSRMVGKIP